MRLHRIPTFIGLFVLAASAARGVDTLGLLQNDPGASAGYTLFAPVPYTKTYLVDNAGRQVRSWSSAYRPGQSVYLLENGDLLRTANRNTNTVFQAGGAGGGIERFDWDGNLIWDYTYDTPTHLSHHDAVRMPNGNVLMIAWELKTSAECVAAGRDPAQLPDGELWPDHVIEVQPTLPSGGTIVWEWHAWDHVVQAFDAGKPNFGVVADHPELINLNYVSNNSADWNHINAIDYNADLDQILLSSHAFSEIWVIDHSTTTAEAAGHTGGARGRGGDLLYRWGNPRAYGAGVPADRRLFAQHNAQWIDAGFSGAGNILIFNNGAAAGNRAYSTVDEIIPAVDAFGVYTLPAGTPSLPAAAAWSYSATPQTSFFATNISGAQRLPNGNTLICDGPKGSFFEVTPEGSTLWRYVNPVTVAGPVMQGTTPANNIVFRATRYSPDDPAFEGRDVTPGAPVELYPMQAGLWVVY